jgi:hypothetical protein
MGGKAGADLSSRLLKRGPLGTNLQALELNFTFPPASTYQLAAAPNIYLIIIE